MIEQAHSCIERLARAERECPCPADGETPLHDMTVCGPAAHSELCVCDGTGNILLLRGLSRPCDIAFCPADGSCVCVNRVGTGRILCPEAEWAGVLLRFDQLEVEGSRLFEHKWTSKVWRGSRRLTSAAADSPEQAMAKALCKALNLHEEQKSSVPPM